MTAVVSVVGLVTVVMCISGLSYLTLSVIADNYVFPPTKWTVKVFLATLFILAIPFLCATWVVGKFFNSPNQRSYPKWVKANVATQLDT